MKANSSKTQCPQELQKLLSTIWDYKLLDEDKDFINQIYRREEFSKRHNIFMNGDINTRHYFVEKGLLRLYVIDPKGKEFNVLFAQENQIIGDLITPAATSMNLDTIEDSVVWSIDNNQFLSIQKRFATQTGPQNFDYLKRSYIFLQKRLISILTHSAQENYQSLLQDYPSLIKRLPQYHIASYLGISPEFLSKTIAKV